MCCYGSNEDDETVTLNVEKLLSEVRRRAAVRNNARLAAKIEVSPATISKVLSRKLPMNASLLLRLHEVSGLSISEMREMMGDVKGYFGEKGQLLASGSVIKPKRPSYRARPGPHVERKLNEVFLSSAPHVESV